MLFLRVPRGLYVEPGVLALFGRLSRCPLQRGAPAAYRSHRAYHLFRPLAYFVEKQKLVFIAGHINSTKRWTPPLGVHQYIVPSRPRSGSSLTAKWF